MAVRRGYYFFFFLWLSSIATSLFSQRHLVDSLHLILDEELQDRSTAIQLAQLAQAYWPLDPDSSLTYGRQAVELAMQLDYPAALAKARNSLGGAYFLRGSFEEAIREFESALELRHGLKDQSGAASCLNNLGNVYLEQGNFSRALDYFLQSLQLEENSGTPRGRAIALLNIAIVHFKQKNWEVSRKYTEKALNQFRELPNENGYHSYAYNNLGNIAYEADQDYQSALEYHLAALKLRRELESPALVCSSLINVGAVYLAMNAHEQALEYLDEAYQTALRHGHRTALPDILINQGKAKELAGDMPQALDLYRRALREARLTGATPKTYDAADRLSNALYQAGNYREAYDFKTIAYAYHDSLLNEKNVRQLTQLEMKYEFDKERALQEQDNRRAINQQKYIRNTVIIFLFFALLGLWSMYRNHLRVKRSNQLLTQKNNEILQKTREIEQQKEELNILNETKDKLFSVIAHDLRSPLAGLKSVMLFADSDDITPEEIKALLPQINKNLDDASGLLENLLYWARSQMGGEHMEKEEIDLKTLIDDTVNLLSPQAKSKGIDLRSEVESTLIALADENMIYLILRNLISNALKFTQADGTVTVRAEPCNGHLCLAIQDTGIGISREDQKKMFSNEFFSTAGTNREKGTGLGLMLSKDFVELHGGKLTVDSSPGKGSTFRFTIPTG